jgi:transcriptional regulator with XRE-family HTH domain
MESGKSISPNTKSFRYPAVLEIRLELVRRGWRVKDLARMCGMSPGTMSNWICRGFPESRTRWAVEKALGRRIWSTASEFRKRKALDVRLGFDAYLLEKTELQARMVQLGVPYCKDGVPRKKRDQIADLMRRFL